MSNLTQTETDRQHAPLSPEERRGMLAGLRSTRLTHEQLEDAIMAGDRAEARLVVRALIEQLQVIERGL